MGIGVLIGGAMGTVVGFSGGDDPRGGFIRFSAGEKALMGAVVLGGAGLLVGSVVGMASSTSTKTVDPLPGNDFSVLKPLARYPSVEPDWLRKYDIE